MACAKWFGPRRVTMPPGLLMASVGFAREILADVMMDCDRGGPSAAHPFRRALANSGGAEELHLVARLIAMRVSGAGSGIKRVDCAGYEMESGTVEALVPPCLVEQTRITHFVKARGETASPSAPNLLLPPAAAALSATARSPPVVHIPHTRTLAGPAQPGRDPPSHPGAVDSPRHIVGRG
jgi:hypothetical protein